MLKDLLTCSESGYKSLLLMYDFTAAILVNQLIDDEEHLEITAVLNEGLPRALPD